MKPAINTSCYVDEVNRALFEGYFVQDLREKHVFPYTYYGTYSILHNHDYWELIIVLSGTYTHVRNGESSQLNKHQAVLLRPHLDSHYFKNALYGSSQFTMRIRASHVKNICDSIHEGFYNELISRPLNTFSLSEEDINHIIDYTTIINNRPAIDSVAPTYFLINFILEKIMGNTYFFEKEKPQWFSQLLLDISAPQNTHWSVNDVVTHSNFSHTHLLRAFKKYENCSLVEYLTKIKMMNACNFLLYSDMSILDIALILGYSDSSHLNRMFKKFYNISPRQFKQNNKS